MNTATLTGRTVLVGDFNGDGRPDILSNGTVSLGNGDGTFTAVVSTGTVSGLAVGDFNGDGKLDVASGTGVLLGNGDGTFTNAPGTFPTFTTGLGSQQDYVTAAIVGDFNGDGNADIAFLNEPYGSTGYYVVVVFGHGDGTFTASSTKFSGGSHSTGMVSGDFNGDGKIDLAIGGSDNNRVLLLLGVGDGTFTGPTNTVANNYSLAAGDFNGDGFTDLVSSGQVFLSNGDGSFGPGMPIQTSGSSSVFGGDFYAVGDFNGDGKLDVAGTSTGGTQYAVEVGLGNGDGTFTAFAGTLAYPATASLLAPADFNGDGLADLVVGNQFSGTASMVVLTQTVQTLSATVANISPVGSGTHLIKANYVGDAIHSSALSSSVSLAAQSGVSTLSLTVNPSSSSYGQQVVLSATIAPYTVQGHSTNGESITFFNGATSLGTGVLASGVATLNLTALSSGTDSLTAVYGGDTNFSTVTSNVVSYSVSGGAPAIGFAVGNHTFGDAPFAVSATSNSTGAFTYSVVSGPATIAGATVTLTGAGTVVLQASEVAAGAYNAGTQQATFTVGPAAQTITFPALATPLTYGVAPVPLAATASSGLGVSFSVLSGPATAAGYVLTITGVGTVVVAANQAGNGNYAAATPVSQMVVVNAATPVVSFAQPAAIVYGTALGGVLTASATSAGAGVPGGFTFKTGTTALTGTTVLAAGSYPLVATFTPTDATRYNGATATVTLVVNKASPSVVVTSSLNPGQVQNSLGLTATVGSGVSTPSGTVAFFDGGAPIGSASLVNGTGTLSLALSAGSHTVTAMYSGDANFVSVTSAAYAESVQDINLAGGATTSQTVTAGGAASYTLSISPVNGTTFPAAVTFTATGLPSGATAMFTPQTISPGSAASSLGLSIQTVKQTSMLKQDRDLRGRLAIMLALLLPLPMAVRRSRRRLGALTSLLLLTFVAGCGGGNTASPSPVTPTPTAQTYIVTVSATSGLLSHSVPLTLIVQ